MATLLQQAIDLAKAGERDAAETLIRQVLETNPNNEVAWIWLSGVSRDVLVKREALKRVLQLNPDNKLAIEGLKRFGGDVPEEPEPPEFEPPVIPASPEETPIGNTGEVPAIDLPPANLPPIVTADTISEPDLSPDVDWSVDAFVEDFAAPPPVPTEDKPVFEDLPGDFDFNLDEPPVFDIDLEDLTPDEPVALVGDDDFSPGIAEEPPIIETPLSPDEPLGAADRLEDLFARADIISDETTAEAEIEEEPDIDPESLTAAETLDEITFSPPPGEDIHKILEQRRRRQNRMLIAAAIFFAIMIMGSCSLYYYVTEIADIYILMPQLAGETLEKKAPKPKNGVSTIKFNGFPASSATINWKEAPDAPTCQSSTVGLKVDFKNGDPPSLFSNRNCSNGDCTFKKEISPGAITDVEVIYICGKDAIVTLHK